MLHSWSVLVIVEFLHFILLMQHKIYFFVSQYTIYYNHQLLLKLHCKVPLYNLYKCNNKRKKTITRDDSSIIEYYVSHRCVSDGSNNVLTMIYLSKNNTTRNDIN